MIPAVRLSDGRPSCHRMGTIDGCYSSYGDREKLKCRASRNRLGERKIRIARGQIYSSNKSSHERRGETTDCWDGTNATWP